MHEIYSIDDHHCCCLCLMIRCWCSSRKDVDRDSMLELLLLKKKKRSSKSLVPLLLVFPMLFVNDSCFQCHLHKWTQRLMFDVTRTSRKRVYVNGWWRWFGGRRRWWGLDSSSPEVADSFLWWLSLTLTLLLSLSFFIGATIELMSSSSIARNIWSDHEAFS